MPSDAVSGLIDEARAARVRRQLLRWGRGGIERYAWRYQTDPYQVLVSEFMLHRTQARQVAPVYDRFIAAYPRLADYALANDDEVAAVVSSLGLRWRLAGMRQALLQIWATYGRVPGEYELLVATKGIGQYIAGATVCFTQNVPIALVDSNTLRVTGRVFGLKLDERVRKKVATAKAIGDFCDRRRPRDFYYALIDLSHQYCRPRTACCGGCPLRHAGCVYAARETGSASKSTEE